MMNHAVINGASASRQTETLAYRGIPTDALLPQLEVILDPESAEDCSTNNLRAGLRLKVY